MSNTAVFYRCIPYTATAVSQIARNPIPDFGVYPNPSSGLVTISLPDNAETLRVINTLGQCLIERKVANHSLEEIELSAAGLYFVEVSAQGISGTRKLVIR
jgi:hypothetical protein